MSLEVDGANPSSLPKKLFSFFRKVYLNWLTGSPVAQLHRAVVVSARLGVGVSPGHKKVGKFFYKSFEFLLGRKKCFIFHITLAWESRSE